MRKALHILGTLEDADVDWMARQGDVQHILAGSVLIEELKPIDHLFIVLDGEFSVRIGGIKGTEVARLLSGEVLGEISFVDTRPPSASVIAVQGSYVLALRRDMLTAKLERDGPFAARFYHAIAKFLADRLSMTTGRLGYGNPQQDADVDQIDDEAMEGVSMAAVRFDQLLRQLRGDYRARSAGVN
jgi:CRP-like cAMP-binding protein